MDYPERIEALAVQLAAKTREVQDLREQIGLRESSATLEVLNARDAENRPLHSNETSRNAAIQLALAASAKHQEAARRVAAAETERAGLQANVERLRNEFRLHLLDRQQEIAAMNSQ